MAKRFQYANENPSASEIGAIFKRPEGRINIALVYPNNYPVGMSSLGFQTVYRLFNEYGHVVCERAFLPQQGPSDASGIKTVESCRDLKQFDIVAFSVSFENDYPNILRILDTAGIPLKAEHRNSGLPLIIAGGVACFLNPEPLASFIDCFLIGEAEAVLPEFFKTYDPKRSRSSNLLCLARHVPGAYVPALYETVFDSDGAVKTFEPVTDVPIKVCRPYAEDISGFSTTSTVISPHAPFGRMFLIEVGRGCPHRCRFCSTGYVYRPPRFRSLGRLADAMNQGIALTDHIGLVGAAVTDLPDLPALCRLASETDARVSFSSLRADRLSGEIIEVLRNSRIKTAAIAPDAGSERMREVIKKGLTEEAVLAAVQRLVEAGIPNVKLYFMVGLPTETAEDVEAIVKLVARAKTVFLTAGRSKKRVGTITVSLNPFVPKPFTPFQWTAAADGKSIKQKIKHVTNGLKSLPNVRVFAESPRQAHHQALLSRGDRQVGGFLIHLHKNKGNWAKTLKETALNTDFYTKEEMVDRILPWHFIDHGFDVSRLKEEYRRALHTSAALLPMH
ncbi:MAG: radical SAM protein [Desulfobacterales bacterium]